jgi:hypothetical protein
MRDHPNFGRLYLRGSAAVIGEIESKIDAAVADRFDEAMKMQADIFALGQSDGSIRVDDPFVLARMFSGLVASFQACDPAVMLPGDPAPVPMPVDHLLDIVEGAFRAAA